MRKWLVWMCAGCLAAAVAAPGLYAQNSDKRTNQSKAPVADRFVSTPGQMVSTPGQMVTGPGQRVMGPGQMVIPPGQTVIPMGNGIAPVPGVITPFMSQSSASTSAGQQANAAASSQGVIAGRREHNRHTYRPGYGVAGHGVAAGYALPYAVNSDYRAGTAATPEPGSSPAVADSRSMIAASGAGASPSLLASAPSGNRPAYQPDHVSQPEAPPPSRDMIQTPEPLLTVVMKDGERKTMRNYALTPQKLIDLDGAGSGREVSISLSRINVSATEKAASQAGLSFVVPGK